MNLLSNVGDCHVAALLAMTEWRKLLGIATAPSATLGVLAMTSGGTLHRYAVPLPLGKGGF